jgi:hypothetical protein
MSCVHQKLIGDNKTAYDNLVSLSFKFNSPRTAQVKKEITQLQFIMQIFEFLKNPQKT